MRQRAHYGNEHELMVWTSSVLGVLLVALFLVLSHLVFLILGVSCLLLALVFCVPDILGKPLLREEILRLLPANVVERALDVGTGMGLIAIGMAKSGRVRHAYGIDISASRLARAVRNAEIEGVSDRVTFQHGDANAIPFPDQHFDVVTANLLLSVIPAQARVAVLSELTRVVKASGKIIISDVLADRCLAVLSECLAEEVRVHQPRGLLRLISPRPIRIITATRSQA